LLALRIHILKLYAYIIKGKGLLVLTSCRCPDSSCSIIFDILGINRISHLNSN